ncbi:MAG: class I SAM-dependent methyltransferase [Gammaproteobacteria bacterium]
MSTRSLTMDEQLQAYLQNVSLREPLVLARLRAETAALPMAVMQISPEQGQFMAFLLKLIGARHCLEIGTFTGYSALVCALALPADGRLVALDVSEEWTAIARRYWAEAGVAERIELRLGSASQTLREMAAEGMQGHFDFIFVDADKTGYDDYLEQGCKLLRTGGLMIFDNVLWSGRVADPAVDDADTLALRALNRKLHVDSRFDLSMVAIDDGLTLLRKRA